MIQVQLIIQVKLLVDNQTTLDRFKIDFNITYLL